MKGHLTVSPSYHDLVLQQTEQSQTFDFTLTNSSSKEIKIVIVGKPSLQKRAKDTFKLYPQIEFPTESILLKPNQTQHVQAVIEHISDIPPGSHYASIQFEIHDPESESANIQVAISSEVFIIKKGGEKPELHVKSVHMPFGRVFLSYPQTLQVDFENRGNIHLTPYGRVDIVDMIGRTVQKGSLNESSRISFPGETTTIPAKLERINWSLPVSYNTIHVTGHDGQNYTHFDYSTGVFSINPIGLIGLIIVISGIMKYRRWFASLYNKLIIRKI